MLKLSVFYGEFALICMLMQYHLIASIHQENIIKRLDIATCLAKFDVKNDMIIKTAESRKLGAKYLDSADALSKVECLHLCCETENCDVFVYEEKGQGECFLFHCGPAQDFRCKFSKHANYTSAVLSMEKKVPPPPTVFSKKPIAVAALSQNEIELKSLKSKSSEPVNTKLSSNDVTATTAATTVRAITVPIKNATTHCGRFQFQCHSGDCIAVYNACDGIPQCDDGSDEGPECHSVTRTPDTVPNKSPADGHVKLTSTNANSIIGRNREDPLTAPQWPNLNQAPAIQQYSNGDDKPVFGHNLNIADSIPMDHQPQPDPQFTWGNVGNPSLLSNWPLQMPEFPMKPIQFNEKQPPYTQFRSDLIQKVVGLSDQSQLSKQQQYKWPNTEHNIPSLPNPPNQQILNHLNQNNEEVLPEKDAIADIKDVPVSDRKKDGKNVLQSKSKSESKSSEDSEYNNEEEETTTEPPKKKKKHRKVNKVGKQISENRANVKDDSVQQLNMIQSGLQTEFMDHDGEADRPGGAVVSLALGILITIGLVMVISCRTTTIRKRVRRGKGYAHDADFLVNGMYL